MGKTRSFIQEFKAFASRGNVVDMAVGVIIGGAFKAIVDSLVKDVVMPFVGIFVDTSSFADVVIHVGGADILIGSFIAAVVNFLIVAMVIFLMVKALNKAHDVMTHKEKEEAEAAAAQAAAEPAAEPAPTTEELLADILAELRKEAK